MLLIVHVCSSMNVSDVYDKPHLLGIEAIMQPRVMLEIYTHMCFTAHSHVDFDVLAGTQGRPCLSVSTTTPPACMQ